MEILISMVSEKPSTDHRRGCSIRITIKVVPDVIKVRAASGPATLKISQAYRDGSAEVFTNTVRYHDTVVKRVTDNHYQRCHNGQSRYGITTNTQRNDNAALEAQPRRQSPLKAEPTYTRIQQRHHQRHRTGLRGLPHA